MVIIGLTGGIGSGKSTVLEVWRDMGAYVVKADQLAKRLMKEDPELKQQIIEAFGDQSYDSKGRLNRGFLAEEAFENNRVEELNALVHPKVQSATQVEIKKARKQGYIAFVKEAALLLKEKRPSYLDVVVLIQADPDKRVHWVSERDQVNPGQVRARMRWQQEDKNMRELSDYVITNNGSIDDLKSKARDLLEELLESQ